VNKKLHELAQRREAIVLKAEEQRGQLVQHVEAWRPILSLADLGLEVIGFVKHHPVIAIGAGAVLFKLLWRSQVGKWFGRGWAVWQAVAKFRNRFLA